MATEFDELKNFISVLCTTDRTGDLLEKFNAKKSIVKYVLHQLEPTQWYACVFATMIDTDHSMNHFSTLEILYVILKHQYHQSVGKEKQKSIIVESIHILNILLGKHTTTTTEITTRDNSFYYINSIFQKLVQINNNNNNNSDYNDNEDQIVNIIIQFHSRYYRDIKSAIISIFCRQNQEQLSNNSNNSNNIFSLFQIINKILKLYVLLLSTTRSKKSKDLVIQHIMNHFSQQEFLDTVMLNNDLIQYCKNQIISPNGTLFIDNSIGGEYILLCRLYQLFLIVINNSDGSDSNSCLSIDWIEMIENIGPLFIQQDDLLIESMNLLLNYTIHSKQVMASHALFKFFLEKVCFFDHLSIIEHIHTDHQRQGQQNTCLHFLNNYLSILEQDKERFFKIYIENNGDGDGDGDVDDDDDDDEYDGSENEQEYIYIEQLLFCLKELSQEVKNSSSRWAFMREILAISCAKMEEIFFNLN
ncbi:hypothetical protein CYY_002334 [Polysphondylium violaceum]|uniref:Uncharacterized protein n=1 Tax=Polysphondylium violaceum TaxID=133409 RepID=A0A8J4Q1H3_9MYCE|nr:hypothetical protein CYY_002334 [Polysphondylium violaceum]